MVCLSTQNDDQTLHIGIMCTWQLGDNCIISGSTFKLLKITTKKNNHSVNEKSDLSIKVVTPIKLFLQTNENSPMSTSTWTRLFVCVTTC